MAVLSGASLTTEKTYLMGKFARVCLKTSNIDYNGRLCMVSAGAGNKKAFGIDRAANPWSDITKADVVWISGANVAECAPITTNYVWQAREHGAKIIVVDPRITPIARTCDLFLPVKPGRDVALFNGILHLMIEHDWLDHDFIEQHTVGFDGVAEHVRPWTPARTAEVTGIAEKSIRTGGRMVGDSEVKLSYFMPAVSSTTATACRTCWGRSTSCSPPGGSAARAAAMPRSPARPTGKAAASTGRSAISFPAVATWQIPSIVPTWRKVWDIDPDELPQPGVDAYEIFRKIDRGEIRGLLSICFNPFVSLPDNNFIARMLDKLDFYVAIDFFLNETARHADIVLPGSLQEEDEGMVTQIEGRVIKINKAVDPPGDATQDWQIIQDIAAALDARTVSHFESRARFSTNCVGRAKGASPTIQGSPRRRSSSNTAFVGPARRRIIPARRDCSNPVRGIRSPRVPGRTTSPMARRGSMSPSTRHQPRTSTRSIRSS